MENVTLNVKGMSYRHCANVVGFSVGNLDGVEQVKVNLETGRVDVSFSQEKVNFEMIKETINDSGYDVE